MTGVHDGDSPTVLLLAFFCPVAPQYSCRGARQGHSAPNHISEMVPPTIHLGPPSRTVDTTFEMWLGSLSIHRGLG